MITLIEAADKVIKERLEWLKEARQAKDMLSLFPELEKLSVDLANIDSNGDNSLTIRLTVLGDEADEGARLIQKAFETFDIKFEEPQHLYGETFQSEGKTDIRGIKLSTTITGYGIPIGCEIVRKKRMRIVSELICEKTGKAPKK